MGSHAVRARYTIWHKPEFTQISHKVGAGSRNFLPIPDLSLYAGSFKMLRGPRGYGNGDYDERRYAVAADKLHTKCIEERLAFLPPKERTFNRMTDDL